MLDQTGFAQLKHLLWTVDFGKEVFGGFVHTGIRRLRAQGNCDHKGIDVHVIQLTLWRWFFGLEPAKNFPDRMIIELLGHACPMP